MAFVKTTFINGQAPALSAEELNKMGQGIEEAHYLAGKAQAITGTYTGDGTASRTINLGFKPSAVLLMSNIGAVEYQYTTHGGLAVGLSPAYNSKHKSYKTLDIVSNGFNVYFYNSAGTNYQETNKLNVIYHYLAFK